MPVIPLGFTDITPDYKPFDYPPDTSGLSENDMPVVLDGKIVIATEVITPQPAVISVLPLDSVSPQLTLKTDRTYAAPGDLIELTCEVNRQINGSFIVRLLNSIGLSVDLPDRAIVGQFVQGVGKVQIRLGLDTLQNSNLYFIAYLPQTAALPSLEISQIELRSLTVSNAVTLSVITPTNVQGVVDAPIPPQVPIIPLHDVGVTTSTSTLKSYLIQENVDLAPTNAAPRGSSGQGIYSEHNLPSPSNRSMHRAVPTNALQRLLGGVQDQLKRLQSWSEKILYTAHASEDNENSEVSLLLDLLPDALQESIDRYRELINQAGCFSSDSASAYLPDYANGNTLVTSHAVEQHNVGQLRVQTTSVFDVNSPTINIAAQQSVSQIRFDHHAGDIYQGSYIHIWSRAEDQMSLMTKQSVRYASSDSADLSANSLIQTGDRIAYSDTELVQIGQTSEEPLHPDNSRSSGKYGKSTTLVLKDYGLKSFNGQVLINAATLIELASEMGLKLVASGGDLEVASNTNVSLQGVEATQIYGGESATLNSPNEISVYGAAKTVIQGGLTLINCGLSALEVPPQTTVAEFPEELKEYSQLRDPEEYPREQPLAPGGVGQSVPSTPEPNSTPGGPVRLGQFFAGPVQPREQASFQPSNTDIEQ